MNERTLSEPPVTDKHRGIIIEVELHIVTVQSSDGQYTDNHCIYKLHLMRYRMTLIRFMPSDNGEIKVKGSELIHRRLYRETRTAAVYNAKWRTDQHWQ